MERTSPLLNELSSLQATVYFADTQMKEKKAIRDQIINLLRAPIKDIRDWADIAFSKAHTIQKQFNSEYYRKQYLKRKKWAG
ncbi:MAG: hypothetical protein OCD01_05295 [Fibrobacterales bacterium]